MTNLITDRNPIPSASIQAVNKILLHYETEQLHSAAD